MKKSIAMLAFCLLSVALFAQTDDVLSLQDAIALYEDDKTERYNGDRVIEIIKALVAEDINASMPDREYQYDFDYGGYTPLLYASQSGYTEIVKSLIAEGADIIL